MLFCLVLDDFFKFRKSNGLYCLAIIYYFTMFIHFLYKKMLLNINFNFNNFFKVSNYFRNFYKILL